LSSQLALSSQDGEADLFIPSEELGTISTMLQNRENSVLRLWRYNKSLKVRTTTLDNYIRERKIEKVDFIKIDAEGAEREIIKGAEKTIREFKPRMAIAAYHLRMINVGNKCSNHSSRIIEFLYNFCFFH